MNRRNFIALMAGLPFAALPLTDRSNTTLSLGRNQTIHRLIVRVTDVTDANIRAQRKLEATLSRFKSMTAAEVVGRKT